VDVESFSPVERIPPREAVITILSEVDRAIVNSAPWWRQFDLAYCHEGGNWNPSSILCLEYTVY
jgi:hypothetical protein